MLQFLQQEFESNVDIDTLDYYPGNPRRGDIPAIRDSINSLGWFGCLYVQKSTRFILAGNQSCVSALAEGAKSLPVLFITCDDRTAKKIVIAANRLADRGDYDLDDLAAMLRDISEVDTLTGTGFDGSDVEDLLAELDARTKEADRKAGIENYTTSDSEEWYTPIQFIEAARDVMGSIDLDPASCEAANETVKAGRFYTKEDNGLVQTWSGNVWINPPYGKAKDHEGKTRSNQEIWTDRLIDLFRAGHVSQSVVLVNSVTETEFFQRCFSAAGIVCLVKARIGFINATGEKKSGGLKGSAIFYFGENKRFFFNAFKEFGTIATRSEYYNNEFTSKA